MRTILTCALGILTSTAALHAQAPPALDIVFLVEDSIAATSLVRKPDLSALRPGDRVAVMTFAGKQSLRLAFEADFAKAGAVLSDLGSKVDRSSTQIVDAIAAAAALFDAPTDPGRRRAIFVVFSAEEKSSDQTLAAVRDELRRRQTSLSAVMIPVRRPVHSIPQVSRVPNRTPEPLPPEVWKERPPPGTTGTIAAGTLLAMEELALQSGGLFLYERWDPGGWIDSARDRP